MVEENRLYYGDNFDILRGHVATESVDLIYLDPPFNSKRNYNVIYDGSTAQAEAFKDTWSLQSWQDEQRLIYEEEAQRYSSIDRAVRALEELLSRSNPSLLGYLVMMAIRLAELHRVLKPTGSIYLHCDPTASHYLKIVLDAVFGSENFRGEIIWKRSSAHSDAKQGGSQYGRIHDVLLFYTKGENWTWNTTYTSYDDSYLTGFYKYIEPETGRRYRMGDLSAAKPGGDTQYEWRVKKRKGGKEWESDLDDEWKAPRNNYEYKGVPPYKGRFWAYSKANMMEFARAGRICYAGTGTPNYKRYLDEMEGVSLQDLWSDIPPIGSKAAERLGYPTQKPEALLDRIISASSNEGDLVLDPFCGCGTTVAVAQRLKRRWIGIDITFLAVDLIRQRLLDHYYRGETGLNEADAKRRFDTEIEIFGIPRDLEGARQLATKTSGDRVRKEFEKWAVFSVGGVYSEVKGADAGMDGYFYIHDIGENNKPKKIRCPIQVKSGQVHVGNIRDFSHVIDREKALLGIFVTLEEATRPMREEIVRMPKARLTTGQEYDRIIIVQVQDILNDNLPKLPIQRVTKRAERVVKNEQGELFKEGAEE